MQTADLYNSTMDVATSVWLQRDSGSGSFANTFKLSESTVAKCVASVDPASSKPLQWVIVTNYSIATIGEAWPIQGLIADKGKWHILAEKAVCDFCSIRPGVDVPAMQQIFDLVRQRFGYSSEYSYELVVDGDDDPHLILKVSVENLPMDQLIAQELEVFEAIAKSDSLSNANKYNIISVV